jgi:hypothetical protein
MQVGTNTRADQPPSSFLISLRKATWVKDGFSIAFTEHSHAANYSDFTPFRYAQSNYTGLSRHLMGAV